MADNNSGNAGASGSDGTNTNRNAETGQPTTRARVKGPAERHKEEVDRRHMEASQRVANNAYDLDHKDFPYMQDPRSRELDPDHPSN